ncbi:MAG: YhfC family glutamic-type intramembrane protease [Candidatus Zixiibacteriota bacterium]
MRIVFTLIFLILAGSLSAQSLPPVKSITDYWEADEQKDYHFFVNDQKVGDMSTRLEVVDGDICLIEERLDLDLASVGLGPKLEIENDLRVKSNGYFSSSLMTVKANGVSQELDVTFNEPTNMIRTVIDKNQDAARQQPVTGSVFSCDNNMISQLELLLAFQNLKPGETLTIPVFSPQGMFSAEYVFQVVGQKPVRYGVFRDSALQVNMLQPTQQTIYIDQMHDLVKIENPSRHLRIEYQRDPFKNRPNPIEQAAQGSTIDSFIRRLPFYGLLLVITIGWLLFLGRDCYKDTWSYILFIIGGCLYPIVYITQVPLQQSYAINYLTPILQSGGSIVLPATIPALIGGIIHETLKLLPLLFAALVLRPKALLLISLGAFVGAGFGFIEGCYISGPLFQARMLTNTIIAERIFAICLHIVTGAMIGYGFARRKWWMYWLIAIGFHSLANYLIVFVATKTITTSGLQTLLAFYTIILLGNMFILQNRFKKGQAGGRKRR